MRTLIVAVIFAVAGTAQAAETITTQVEYAKPFSTMAAEGLRVSAMLPMYDFEVAARAGGESAGDSTKIDNAFGFSAGYASLPVRQLGWTANVSYLELRENGENEGIIRVDGNAAYMANQNIGARAGLNISNFADNDIRRDINMGVGFQAGLLVQLTEKWGADIGYTQMNQSGENYGAELDLTEQGLELGVTGTF